MASSPSDSSHLPHRSDEQWLADLSGQNGYYAQEQAHRDLSRYLYVVVYHYLIKRAVSDHVLVTLSKDELATMAEDFVQDTLERLARNEHALLAKYAKAGSFTSWAAQIAKRIAATEIRRPYWSRRSRSSTISPFVNDVISEGNGDLDFRASEQSGSNPEASLEQKELMQAILSCRQGLSERYQTIFDKIIVELASVEDVAELLGLSANAIYMLVFRVKRSMRKCLAQKGYGPEED